MSSQSHTETIPAQRDGHPVPLASGDRRIGRRHRVEEGRAPAAAARRATLYRLLLAGADVLAAGVAVWISLVALGSHQLRVATFAALPIVFVVSRVIGLYERDELTLGKSTLEEAPALFQLATLYTLLVWLLEDALVDGQLGHLQVLGLWGFLLAALLAGRALARTIARRLAPADRCLLIGDPEGCARVEAKLANNPKLNLKLIACLPLDDGGIAEGGALSGPDDFRALVRRSDAHRLIIAPRNADADDILDAIQMAKALGLKVSILPRVFEVVGSSVEFDDLEGLPVLGLRHLGLSRSSMAIKRVFDVVGALILLVAAAPLVAIIVLATLLESGRPVFFRHVRVGRDGRRFKMIKFRTMIVDADALKPGLWPLNEADGFFKIADDPRVTRVGRVLRSTSLDELPQLIHVLRGEMSLVGPRPLVAEEDRQVEGWHRRRLQLTPGMTGQWQILGSSRVPLREMVKIDYLYAANWSLWQDVKILLRTVPYVLGRRGI